MKSYIKLFVAVFFILAVVRNVKSDCLSVSGKVMYSDNSEIVTSGHVKCYNVNTSELEGIAEIQPTGDYILICVRRPDLYDLIGFPNLEPEIDWIPTGYPDKTQSSQYVHVNVDQNLTGLNIFVKRSNPGGNAAFTANISGIIRDINNMPLSDAIVYAQQGNNNYGFAITDSKGEYTLKNIPLGSYTISANKVSSNTNELQVNLTEDGLTGVNFVMNKIKLSANNILPGDFNLMQNYPNPFNPSTTIKYSVPVSGMVTLQVYNSAGQLVAEPVNAVKDAGDYEISFDASSLSSGVYFYKLTSGSYSGTKKMTLIK